MNNKQTEHKVANKLTEKAGLIFNINTFKNSMKTFFDSHDKEKPKFSGAHVAITATIQKLCQIIIMNTKHLTNKDKSGLRTITRLHFKSAILQNDGLKKYYGIKATTFNKNYVYSDQMPISKVHFNEVVTKVNKELQVTPKAYNFICFLLTEAYLDILNTSYQFISYAKRKSLDGTSVIYSVKNRFEDDISSKICEEINKTMKNTGDKNFEDNEEEQKEESEEDDELEDDESDDESDDELEEKKTKKVIKKNSIKKKKATPISDEESDDDITMEDEELEHKPQKKSSKKASIRKKTTKTRKMTK